jgi:hypothetical protein
VTKTSYLTKLTIDEDSVVNGTMTVNGEETPIAAGTYEGEIVVSPAAADDMISIATVDGETFVKLDDILSALGF